MKATNSRPDACKVIVGWGDGEEVRGGRLIAKQLALHQPVILVKLRQVSFTKLVFSIPLFLVTLSPRDYAVLPMVTTNQTWPGPHEGRSHPQYLKQKTYMVVCGASEVQCANQVYNTVLQKYTYICKMFGLWKSSTLIKMLYHGICFALGYVCLNWGSNCFHWLWV